MADTGIKGVDLYYRNGGKWQYINTGRPSGVENESILAEDMHREMREFRLYLPLYDGVTSLEIGVEESSEFIKPGMPNHKPIVFYGTSITQGGCASRPGMAHTNIISRKLDIEVINFGFSGNGKMETEIAELIAGIDADFYVIECVPNMTAEEVSERTLPLVKTIRERHPRVPLVLVENLIYEKAYLDRELRKVIDTKNEALKAQFSTIVESGIDNVFYISQENAMGGSHEGTVDGVHFTDLGFKLYADFLLSKFEEFGLINN
jgi:hypothetical protein